MTKQISVIGGDLRQKILASLLDESGYEVKIYGFDSEIPENLTLCESIAEAASADAIILPLPVSYNDETVNAPLFDSDIFIKDILTAVPKQSLVLAGRISDYLKGEMKALGISYKDYFLREELMVQNAIPIALSVWI